MCFEAALKLIKSDTKLGMRLPSWSPDTVVRAYYPSSTSDMTSPYLYIESRFGKVPWKETFPEMFSNNWEVVK